jgi:hypothetical protein
MSFQRRWSVETRTDEGRETREYSAWHSMRSRVFGPYHVRHYGHVCIYEPWAASFDEFLKDMGLAPSPLHELDRFPVSNGDYVPWNCRWATRIEQQNNVITNRRIKYAGSTRTIAEWARVLGVHRTTISQRLRRGWSEQDAVSLPRGSADPRSPEARK